MSNKQRTRNGSLKSRKFKDNKKSKSDYLPTNNEKSQIQTFYTNMATQSIKRNYHINNLRPYSSHYQAKQIQSQILLVNSNEKIKPVYSNILDKSPHERIHSILKIKKSKSLMNTHRFKKSSLENCEDQLAQAYFNDISKDTVIQRKTRSIIMNKIQQKFQQSECIKNNLYKKMLSIYNKKHVVCEYYLDQPPEDTTLFRRKKIKLKRSQDIIYSISKKKTLDPNLAFNSNELETVKPIKQKALPSSMNSFYDKYLRKYVDRKKVIINEISSQCKRK